jgi:hypothetical protein
MGLGVADPQANFVWLPVGPVAAPLTLELERRGVVTRPFEREGVRVTIGTPQENDTFLSALHAIEQEWRGTERDLGASWDVAAGDTARHLGMAFDRLAGVLERLSQHAHRVPAGLAPVDAATSERWEAGQVFAHCAEFGRYWLSQVRNVLAAPSGSAVPVGRALDDATRTGAIESGRHKDPTVHLGDLRASAAVLRNLLAGCTAADLAKRCVLGPAGELDALALATNRFIGHLEEHADQLDAIRT